MAKAYRCVIIWQVKKFTNEPVLILKRAGMENKNRKHAFSGILILVAVVSIVLASCQSDPVTISETVEQETLNTAADEPTESIPISEDTLISQAAEDLVAEEINQCLICQSNKQTLVENAYPAVVVASENSGEGWGGEVAPLEPWEKVLIDEAAFTDTVHGKIACQTCHQGVQSPDKETAHTDLIPYPSDDSETFCGECHPNLTAAAENSLHVNLDGFWTVLETRGVPENHPQAQEMFDNHCASCHASCGDCHVSRPTSVNGGFIDGHVFNAVPSMTDNCSACHGSRIGNEYLGKHEDLKADIHFRQGQMICVDCHTGNEMHGVTPNCQDCHQGPEINEIPPPEHRYDGLQTPSCESCHSKVTAGNDNNLLHEIHPGTMSCQVCHSVPYSSCDGCHVSLSEKTGEPIFETEDSYLTFLIGKNPLQSFARPYKYVPVRHVPISSTSFDYYEEGLISNYSNKETWVYTTPHNIQRNTPQTKSCASCHGNPDIFLTADKVAPEELEANLHIIVDVIPPLPY